MRRLANTTGRTGKYSLWDLFSMTTDGKLKSAFLLYSFALGFVYFACCVAGYILLPGLVERALPPTLPVALKNFAESVSAALAGVALCHLISLPVRDKRLVPAGFLWTSGGTALVALILLTELGMGERLDFLKLLAMFAAAPMLLGGAWAYLILRRYRANLTKTERGNP